MDKNNHLDGIWCGEKKFDPEFWIIHILIPLLLDVLSGSKMGQSFIAIFACVCFLSCIDSLSNRMIMVTMYLSSWWRWCWESNNSHILDPLLTHFNSVFGFDIETYIMLSSFMLFICNCTDIAVQLITLWQW